MLHAGLDLSRNRLEVCLLSDHGELVEEFAAPPDTERLRDTLEELGWDVLIADAQSVPRCVVDRLGMCSLRLQGRTGKLDDSPLAGEFARALVRHG